MNRFCPSCKRAWPGPRAVCPDCLAELVEDPSATVRCRHCHRDWPAHMRSCPDCLAELHLGEVDDALASILASGGRLRRPEGVPPFAGGPGCTLLRLAPRGYLVLTGPSELIEASLVGYDNGAVPPLVCEDVDGSTLFRLTVYEAADDSLVAIGGDGAALGTYLRDAGGIDVRDETSAPVARLRRAERGGDWELMETGGSRLATLAVSDVDQEGWVDDRWSLHPLVPDLPLRPLAAVALVVAAKVLFGRRWPADHRIPEEEQ